MTLRFPKFFTFVAEEDRQQLVEFCGVIHCDFLRSDISRFSLYLYYINGREDALAETRW